MFSQCVQGFIANGNGRFFKVVQCYNVRPEVKELMTLNRERKFAQYKLSNLENRVLYLPQSNNVARGRTLKFFKNTYSESFNTSAIK